MILDTVTAAIAHYYVDALADGGRAVGDATRYVGTTDDDCCTPDKLGRTAGSLRVSVARLGTSEVPPNIFATWGACRGKPVAEVHVRVMRCWPGLDAGPKAWDKATGEQLDDAWILGCSSTALLADPGLLNLCDDDGRRVGCSLGGWVVLPVDPAGGCAGNDLTIYVSMAGPCTVIRDSGS